MAQMKAVKAVKPVILGRRAHVTDAFAIV